MNKIRPEEKFDLKGRKGMISAKNNNYHNKKITIMKIIIIIIIPK